jgi:hypothetical protein
MNSEVWLVKVSIIDAASMALPMALGEDLCSAKSLARATSANPHVLSGYRVRFLTNQSTSGFLARIGTVSYSNNEVFFIFSPLFEEEKSEVALKYFFRIESIFYRVFGTPCACVAIASGASMLHIMDTR